MQWLQRLSNKAAADGFGNHDLPAVIPALLADNALDWFTASGLMDTDFTWDDFCRVFKARYHGEAVIAQAELELKNRTQRTGETAIQYAENLGTLGRRAGLGDAAVLSQFLDGLQPQTALQVLLAGKPKTIADAVFRATNVEVAAAQVFKRWWHRPRPKPPRPCLSTPLPTPTTRSMSSRVVSNPSSANNGSINNSCSSNVPNNLLNVKSVINRAARHRAVPSAGTAAFPTTSLAIAALACATAELVAGNLTTPCAPPLGARTRFDVPPKALNHLINNNNLAAHSYSLVRPHLSQTMSIRSRPTQKGRRPSTHKRPPSSSFFPPNINTK